MDLSAIIALVSSHNADPSTTPDHDEPTVGFLVRSTEPKASKPRASSGEQAAPIHDRPTIFGMVLPEKNTLDAKGFLLACRDAGKRSVEKVNETTGEVIRSVKFDQSKVREDLICAIHAYVGYDNRRDFGSQDVEARAKAQRELRGGVVPGPTREEKRAAERSLSGFVAGMPTPAHRILLNLQAREQAAADAMLAAKTDAERKAQRQVLDQIQAAIAQLGF